MTVSERFLNYVSYDTQSSEENENCPSTEKQKVLGNILLEEMKKIGLQDCSMDEHGYVYGYLTASEGCEKEPTIGLIAHMDTAPAFSGTDVKPRIIEQYDGKDIVLNKEKNIVMKVTEFPNLRQYTGESLIVTDGTTLLGADDKSGVAEILTAMEQLIKEGKKHGKICVGFTPDEEIGRGADLFQVESFGADFAYTVDGGPLGELEYENFNGARAIVKVNGANIHPGEAKNKMKSAALMAMEFNAMLPAHEIPAHTEGYEGFYHLCEMRGNEEEAMLDYIIRDHSRDIFEKRKATMVRITEYMNQKYGENTICLDLTDTYYNMREKLEPRMDIVERAAKAFEKCGVTPRVQPIRGGTDGARLSYMGLLCPNLSTGGNNFHGKYEFISIQSMEKMVEVIKELVTV